MAVRFKEESTKIVTTLTPREKKMRFGIGEKSSYRLEETANVFGITGAKIGQIEAMALKKLWQGSPSLRPLLPRSK